MGTFGGDCQDIMRAFLRETMNVSSGLVRACSAALFVLTAGCTAQRMDLAPRHPEQFATWSQDDYKYHLGAGDELAVDFIINPDLDAKAVIGPDGRAILPLIGAVTAAGLTPEALAASLKASYGKVLRHPELEVLVAGYGSAQIFVGGEVKTPGVQPLTRQMDVAQAIMAAGGFQDTARTGEVVVLRRRAADDRPIMRTVDVKNLIAQAAGSESFPVLPGDVIFVPRSDAAEFDVFIDQYVNRAIPFSRNLNYSLDHNNN